MITLCAWCGHQYGFKAAPPWFVVSHGICRTCSDKVLYEALGPSPSRASARHTTEHNGSAWDNADQPLAPTPVTPCGSALRGDSSRGIVIPAPLPAAQVNMSEKGVWKKDHVAQLQNNLECQGCSRGADRPRCNRGEAVAQPRPN